MKEPIDLSDREMANWMCWWLRNLAVTELRRRGLRDPRELPRGLLASLWDKVLFRALDRFPGEPTERVRDVYDRCRAAHAKMATTIRWRFGERE
jgi:hypothetical protein